MSQRKHARRGELKRAQAEIDALVAELDAGGESPALIRRGVAARRALARFNRRLLSVCVRRKAADAADGNLAALDELARLFAAMPRAVQAVSRRRV